MSPGGIHTQSLTRRPSNGMSPIAGPPNETFLEDNESLQYRKAHRPVLSEGGFRAWGRSPRVYQAACSRVTDDPVPNDRGKGV